MEKEEILNLKEGYEKLIEKLNELSQKDKCLKVCNDLLEVIEYLKAN